MGFWGPKTCPWLKIVTNFFFLGGATELKIWDLALRPIYISSSSTPDREHRKVTKTQQTREPRGQPFPSRWLQGCKEQTRQPKKIKGAKIRNRCNQVPHMTQDTNGKVTNSQLDTTNESQEVSPFPASDHKAHINRHAQRHSKRKTEKKTIKDPQKTYRLGTVSKIFYWRA